MVTYWRRKIGNNFKYCLLSIKVCKVLKEKSRGKGTHAIISSSLVQICLENCLATSYHRKCEAGHTDSTQIVPEKEKH